MSMMCLGLAHRPDRLSVKLRADEAFSNVPGDAVSPTHEKEPKAGPSSIAATASERTTTPSETSSTAEQAAIEVYRGRSHGPSTCSTDARLKFSKPVEKHVSFATLEFRQYDIILGDHPNCSVGPPVSFRIDRGCNVCISSYIHQPFLPLLLDYN